jgi:hypothetical protein
MFNELYGDFLKWGYPQIIKIFHDKPDILGTPIMFRQSVSQFLCILGSPSHGSILWAEDVAEV